MLEWVLGWPLGAEKGRQSVLLPDAQAGPLIHPTHLCEPFSPDRHSPRGWGRRFDADRPTVGNVTAPRCFSKPGRTAWWWRSIWGGVVPECLGGREPPWAVEGAWVVGDAWRGLFWAVAWGVEYPASGPQGRNPASWLPPACPCGFHSRTLHFSWT